MQWISVKDRLFKGYDLNNQTLDHEDIHAIMTILLGRLLNEMD